MMDGFKFADFGTLIILGVLFQVFKFMLGWHSKWASLLYIVLLHTSVLDYVPVVWISFGHVCSHPLMYKYGLLEMSYIFPGVPKKHFCTAQVKGMFPQTVHIPLTWMADSIIYTCALHMTP